jgi:hypothetical protein
LRRIELRDGGEAMHEIAWGYTVSQLDFDSIL